MKKRKAIILKGEEGKPTIHYLLSMLEDSRNVTLKAIRDISQEELNWQPFEGWNTIGALLLHTHSVNEVLRIKYVENRILTAEETKTHHANVTLGEHLPKVLADHPLDFYLKKLEASRERLVNAVSALDQETFYKVRKGYDPENGCNLAWVLYHIVEDELNHKGQIMLIRKLYKERKTLAVLDPKLAK